MRAFISIYLLAISTSFIYEAIEASPIFEQIKNFDGGITNMVFSWLSQHAPGKAGNEGEFHLPAKGGAQPMMIPAGSNGMMNNRQPPGLGQQAFGPGAGRMLPNAGPGAMGPNNQLGGPQQQPMPLGAYRGPALSRAGRR